MSETPLGLRRSTHVVTALLLVLYCVVAAEKPVAIYYTWIADEKLFLDQALELVRGHWLGAYWTNTLVKGPAYPLFLAVNHLLGLSVGMGQALLYFGAVFYCARVAMRLVRRRWAFLATLVTLLVIPIFYDHSMLRLLRDTFYTAMVLLYFAALLDTLVVDAHRPRWSQAAAWGLLGGLVWITREEREWIVPATLFAIAMILWTRRARWRAPALGVATAALAMAAVLATISYMNLTHYGRFVINELKDANFVGAMSAIQRASAPDFRPYVPAPQATRLRLYEESPTFARLRSFLDPPGGAPPPWNYACGHPFYRGLCGDIAAGWFLWALRDGANRIGAHKDAHTAAAFYRSIADEIEAACARGRLRCGYRMPFLMPYMSAGQIASIPGYAGQALRLVAMLEPVSFAPPRSSFDDRREEVLRLLNYPAHVDQVPRTDFFMVGWYRRHGDEWFSVSGTQLSQPIVVTRLESPDLVTHFGDARVQRQRFTLQASCSGDCLLTFVDQQGQTLTISPHRAVVPKGYALGDGALYLDQSRSSFRSPRASVYASWLRVVGGAKPALSSLVILGAVGLVALLVVAVRRREVASPLVVISILWIAVLTRVGLVSLVAAGSFPAVAYHYVVPAIPLAVLAGVVAVFALVELVNRGEAPGRRGTANAS